MLQPELDIPESVHATCAVVLYHEGQLHSKILTGAVSEAIEWSRDEGTLIVVPGNSKITSNGDGLLVVYFENYLSPTPEDD